MNDLTVYYNINQASCFSVDEIFVEPETVFSYETVERIYNKCPAWSHKAKRTFLIKAQVDLKLTVAKDKVFCEPKDLEKNLDLTPGWNYNGGCTVQLGNEFFYLFWTKEKNVWIHQQPYPPTVQKNFSVVEGWYNGSAWNRPISFSFNVIDREKPIIIKRGDPLFAVSFYTKDLNRKVHLERTNITHDQYQNVFKRMAIRSFKSLQSVVYKKMFETTEESKCPMNFMWKK